MGVPFNEKRISLYYHRIILKIDTKYFENSKIWFSSVFKSSNNQNFNVYAQFKHKIE